MIIKGDLRRRLRELQKQAGIGRREKKFRLWYVFADDEKRAEAEIEKIKGGKIEHKDGGRYSETDANFFVDVRYTPRFNFDFSDGAEKVPKIEQGPESSEDPEGKLKREIAELEARKRELMAKKKKARTTHKKRGKK